MVKINWIVWCQEYIFKDNFFIACKQLWKLRSKQQLLIYYENISQLPYARHYRDVFRILILWVLSDNKIFF